MAKQYLMAVDAGTGSVRAVFVRHKGQPAWLCAAQWEHKEDPRWPGSMDFDWAYNWQLASGCIRGCWPKRALTRRRSPPFPPPACARGIVLYDKDGREIWACANVDARSNDEVGELIRMNPGLEKEVYLESGQTYALGALPPPFVGEKQKARGVRKTLP